MRLPIRVRPVTKISSFRRRCQWVAAIAMSPTSTSTPSRPASASRARRPTTHGNLRFYLENDFFGSSEGYEFRLRHAYGQLGNTYAGYGYSSFIGPGQPARYA